MTHALTLTGPHSMRAISCWHARCVCGWESWCAAPVSAAVVWQQHAKEET